MEFGEGTSMRKFKIVDKVDAKVTVIVELFVPLERLCSMLEQQEAHAEAGTLPTQGSKW